MLYFHFRLAKSDNFFDRFCLSRYDDLMQRLKLEFCGTTDYKRRLQILTLSPFSLEQTAKFFGTSLYMARKARKLKNDVGLLPDIHNMHKGSVIESSVKQKVVEFYESDSVSRMCPGVKDFVSVRNPDGLREKVQKRLILGTLSEVYKMYKDDPENPHVGFSSFCSLRPKHCVSAGSSGTHTVCVCLHHQNVKLMVESFGKKLTYHDLIDYAVCDCDAEECMMGRCGNCPGEEGVLDFLELVQDTEEDNYEFEQRYKQWVSTDRCELIDVVETRAEFLQNLARAVVKLTKHHFVSHHQSKTFREMKDTLAPGETVVVGDFSQNYTFVLQDEVQSHHWDAGQCTVHPFVVYWREEGGQRHQSFCIISETTKHITSTVHAFLTELMPALKVHVPNLHTIHFFSDGCAGQYKNRFNFLNVCHYEEDFGVKCDWNFFATSHGKSACDGVGGTIKRATAHESLRRPYTDQITNARDMYKFLTEKFKTSILCIYVGKVQVEQATEKLKGRFRKALAIKGTRDIHSFIPVSRVLARVAALSGQEGREVRVCRRGSTV